MYIEQSTISGLFICQNVINLVNINGDKLTKVFPVIILISEKSGYRSCSFFNNSCIWIYSCDGSNTLVCNSYNKQVIYNKAPFTHNTHTCIAHIYSGTLL